MAALPCLAEGWNPQLAANYLDQRQQAWFAWPTADDGHGGRCLSCHTGLTYLLARPALRHELREKGPTEAENRLLTAVRRRLSAKTPKAFLPTEKEPLASQELGVEAVLSALVLASDDQKRAALSKDAELAFERLWSLQISKGEAKGAWNWNSLALDPWEQPDSMFYGASLAALAVGIAPVDYQSRQNIRRNVEALTAYLNRHQETQPLHNRLVLVWASAHLPGTLSKPDRKAILEDVMRQQEKDGGWTTGALGPWPKHPTAPPSNGSNAYATAIVAFILQRAGVPPGNPAVTRALDWLRSHQDPKAGFWEAPSMNKPYAAESMPSLFMQDAATGFATLALLEAQ